MFLWAMLLQMRPLTALCDPFGSCYDISKVPSVAGGEAAAAKPLGGVWEVRWWGYHSMELSFQRRHYYAQNIHGR